MQHKGNNKITHQTLRELLAILFVPPIGPLPKPLPTQLSARNRNRGVGVKPLRGHWLWHSWRIYTPHHSHFDNDLSLAAAGFARWMSPWLIIYMILVKCGLMPSTIWSLFGDHAEETLQTGHSAKKRFANDDFSSDCSRKGHSTGPIGQVYSKSFQSTASTYTYSNTYVYSYVSVNKIHQHTAISTHYKNGAPWIGQIYVELLLTSVVKIWESLCMLAISAWVTWLYVAIVHVYQALRTVIENDEYLS